MYLIGINLYSFFPVAQKIGLLNFVNRIFVDTSELLLFYCAFVLPILENCSPAWGSAAECLLQLLERQVPWVVRLCTDESFLTLGH